jgi:PTH1 family peptidyl-tRNA hydrolase
MADERNLVVGLGNPGLRYAATRHNAGYRVVDLMADRIGGRFRALRGRVDVLEGKLGGEPVVLAKPRLYMNDSGGPVSTAARFYRVPAERIVVVHDELDLPFGRLRVKLGGGDNGHNGLKSIRAALGTGDFYRVRLGIDRPQGRRPTADHVLSDYTAAEREELPAQLDAAADAVASLMTRGLEETQSAFNGAGA